MRSDAPPPQCLGSKHSAQNARPSVGAAAHRVASAALTHQFGQVTGGSVVLSDMVVLMIVSPFRGGGSV
jgi:hypothetical protein